MQGRGGRVVGLVVGTSLLAACTGGGGGAEEGASEAPSSSPSTPVVSSSSEAAVPVLPDEARGDDDAAAVAFVEHWVELVNYALRTGDTAPARESAPQCSTCDAVLDDIESTFGEQEPGQWALTEIETYEPRDEDAASTDVVVVGGISTDGSGSEASGDLTFGIVAAQERPWTVSWLDVRER